MATETSNRQKTSTTTSTTSPPSPTPGESLPLDVSAAGTRESSGTRSTNPLDFDPGAWTPPEEPPPVKLARDFEDVDDAYEPPPAELIEWTPERAGSIVRAGGFVLHTVDPLSKAPGGDELWRATDADVQEIGPPLARILNRYAPARRLAGYSDEAELAIALMAYTRRELATRGRIAATLEEPPPDPSDPLDGRGWSPTQTPQE